MVETLWDIPPRDPSVPAAAAERLSKQSAAILSRLRRGRATNTELSRIAQRFGARKYDLCKAGYDVRLVASDAASGLTWYALFEDGEEVRNA